MQQASPMELSAMREGRRVWRDVGDDAGGVNEDDGNHDVDDDEKRTAAKIETWNTKNKRKNITKHPSQTKLPQRLKH